jgi:hypothetical protein
VIPKKPALGLDQSVGGGLRKDHAQITKLEHLTFWGSQLSRIDEYVARAQAHLKLAEGASDPKRQALHLSLAQSYFHLSEYARKYLSVDLVYETPPSTQPPPVLQYQQPQRKKGK